MYFIINYYNTKTCADDSQIFRSAQDQQIHKDTSDNGIHPYSNTFKGSCGQKVKRSSVNLSGLLYN